MTLSDILNADMATLARWLRAGWDWWLAELRGLVPARLSDRLGAGDQIVARPQPGGRFEVLARGVVLPPERRKGVSATLAVAPRDCLIRELRLPALARADLERLVTLDADRLMPFPPGEAVVAVEPGAREADGRQRVTIAALPRPLAAALLDAAAAARIEVRRFGVAGAGGVRFDFLPALRQGRHSGLRPAQRWWAMVGLLFALNLAVLVVRDVRATRALEELVAANGERAATARQLRARVMAEDARRQAQVAQRRATDPLPLLAALTRALPDGAWVQRLGWDGAQLRLAGFKRAEVDVVAAMRRVPGLGQVRSSGADIAARQEQGEPFDVTATVPGRTP